MKKIYLLLLAVFLPYLFLITSCRKDGFNDNETDYLDSKQTSSIGLSSKDIFNWIDKHKSGLTVGNTNKLDILKENIEIDQS